MNEVEKAIDNLKETLRMQKSALRGLSTSYQPKAGLNDDIKATDLAIRALEKQMPEKPKNIRNILFSGTTKPNFSDGECPNCGGYVNTDDNRYVCGQSGCCQALDWSVDE